MPATQLMTATSCTFASHAAKPPHLCDMPTTKRRAKPKVAGATTKGEQGATQTTQTELAIDWQRQWNNRWPRPDPDSTHVAQDAYMYGEESAEECGMRPPSPNGIAAALHPSHASEEPTGVDSNQSALTESCQPVAASDDGELPSCPSTSGLVELPNTIVSITSEVWWASYRQDHDELYI